MDFHFAREKSNANGEIMETPKNVFDLGAFVGDLTIEDDASSDDVSLEGLEQELEECKNDDVVANILSKGTKLREHAKGVENNLRQVELDSIQEYIKESDRLVSLHDQICECDSILSQMETLLTGFQAEIGSISSDIKILQEKSMDMGLKLKNRKVAELKLARFVEDIIVPPRMIDIIVDGEVNEEYMRTLEILSKKLKFVEVDPMVKASKAIKDVQPELEKLRQKAVSKTMLLLITIHMPAVTRSPQERNTRLENMCWRIWNLARHKKQERKLKEMLNVDLSVKEGVERQLLICQKIYQKENEQMCLVICILMARVLKEECLGLVQLMLWRIGPISRKRRSCTSS